MKKKAKLKKKTKVVDIAEVRQAVANYMWSEGCSCCQFREAHDEHKERLAKLLNVPKYPDGSGFNFYRFGSDKPKKAKKR